jgi:hypothetical protein
MFITLENEFLTKKNSITSTTIYEIYDVTKMPLIPVAALTEGG